MLEVEKVLREKDLDELGKRLSRKRNSFTDKINSQQHESVNKKLYFCAVSMDLCLSIFQDFMVAFAKNINELNNTEKDYLDGYAENLAKVRESQKAPNTNDPNKKEDDLTIELYREKLFLSFLHLWHARETFEANAFAYQMRIDLLSLSLIGIIETFELIIEETDPAAVKERTISIIKSLLGLASSVPVYGVLINLATLGWDAYNLTRIEESRTNAASETLHYLDDFANSTFLWSVHAQMLTDFDYVGTNLQDASDNRARLYEAMINKARMVVNTKLNKLLERVNERKGAPNTKCT